jgi:hypothetical protein
MPIKELAASEGHPRESGPPYARFRRETEDILRSAGGTDAVDGVAVAGIRIGDDGDADAVDDARNTRA